TLPCTASHSFICHFNAPPTTGISSLSLHDALPILECVELAPAFGPPGAYESGSKLHALHTLRDVRSQSAEWRAKGEPAPPYEEEDRKSTRLNSSHRTISYAVFCLKKKTKTKSKLLA